MHRIFHTLNTIKTAELGVLSTLYAKKFTEIEKVYVLCIYMIDFQIFAKIIEWEKT